jgi:hypothetical protein
LSVATRPAVAALISVPLGYLADECVDVSVVIGAVQKVLQNAINDAAAGLSIVALMAVAADVAGVERVPRVLLNGDIVDLPAGDHVIDVPAMVSVECVIVE